ncbi:MAG TPA: hypothetical protein VM389_09080, partial [Phycisphaerae bacterium]|nr:hypothetical protein [Phycisphaerae bacterium]
GGLCEALGGGGLGLRFFQFLLAVFGLFSHDSAMLSFRARRDQVRSHGTPPAARLSIAACHAAS